MLRPRSRRDTARCLLELSSRNVLSGSPGFREIRPAFVLRFNPKAYIGEGIHGMNCADDMKFNLRWSMTPNAPTNFLNAR
jgi:hypothetical protein